LKKQQDEELRIWAYGVKKKIEIQDEQHDKDIERIDKESDERIKAAKKGDKEAIEELKIIASLNIKASKEAQKVLDDIAEKNRLKRIEEAEKLAQTLADIATKSVDKQIEQTQRQLSEQEKAIDTQRDLANRGLENTLAFEERKKAELEQKERDQQKRLERIKKLETYFNLFAEYSKDPEKKDRAALLALKDVLLGEAISQAFAKDGGVVEDLAQPFAGGTIRNGIFVGNSHERGGILLEAEGREGIFSAKEMDNLGKENFYAIKDLLKNPINDDEFSRQEASFINVVPIRSRGDHAVVSAVERLTSKLDSIPQIHQGIDNLDRIVETRVESGIKRTILRPKRQI
jgi:hypothetical protein